MNPESPIPSAPEPLEVETVGERAMSADLARIIKSEFAQFISHGKFVLEIFGPTEPDVGKTHWIKLAGSPNAPVLLIQVSSSSCFICKLRPPSSMSWKSLSDFLVSKIGFTGHAVEVSKPKSAKARTAKKKKSIQDILRRRKKLIRVKKELLVREQEYREYEKKAERLCEQLSRVEARRDRRKARLVALIKNIKRHSFLKS